MACADCFKGCLNGETPTGSVSKIHGLDTYVARPQNKAKGLIVILPDAFGWDTPNIRVLADRYAQNGGFLVYVPEVMQGHSIDASVMSNLERVEASAGWYETLVCKPAWIFQMVCSFIPFIFFCRASVSKPIVFDFFRALRTSPETSSYKIGAAGFCWGGKYTVLLSQDTPSSRVHNAQGQLSSLIDAGFTAHPSLLSIPGDLDNVTLPLSICIGDVDMGLKLEACEQAKTILEKKKDGEVVILPGAKHGFAVRGLLSDPKQKDLSDTAEKQAIDWFIKYLS